MKITKTNFSIWENLYRTAVEFRDLAPWEWMHDSDIFGVKDPVTGENSWCCVMGAGREVFALGVYLGKEGFDSYMEMVNSQFKELTNEDSMALVLGQTMLKVEFVNRDEMEKEDLAAFKKLGIKFRGRHQWVQARKMLPGYLPWFMSEEQAVFATHCLQQAITVAKLFKEDEHCLENEEEKILVMASVEKGGNLDWQVTYEHEPEEMEIVPRKADPTLITKAKKELEKKKAAICLSLNYMPSPILSGENETEPFFARMALWIVYGSGHIIASKIFTPKEFDKNFEPEFFKMLHQIGIIPQQLVVDSQMAIQAIEPLTEALGIDLIYQPDIKEFKEVKEGMLGRFF